MRSESCNQVEWWQGETLPLGKEATMIHCGGHFAGSCVTHWDRSSSHKGGFLAVADTYVYPYSLLMLVGLSYYHLYSIMISLSRKGVSFMYSYPNWVRF